MFPMVPQKQLSFSRYGKKSDLHEETWKLFDAWNGSRVMLLNPYI